MGRADALFPLVAPRTTACARQPVALRYFLVSGDQPMRVLAILALALLLTGCEGDRIKNGSMNERQAQPQSTVLT